MVGEWASTGATGRARCCCLQRERAAHLGEHPSRMALLQKSSLWDAPEEPRRTPLSALGLGREGSKRLRPEAPGGLGWQLDGGAPRVAPLQPASGPPGSDPLVTVARQVMEVVPSTEPHPPPHDSTSGPQPPESLGQGLKQEQLGWGAPTRIFLTPVPPKLPVRGLQAGGAPGVTDRSQAEPLTSGCPNHREGEAGDWGSWVQ